MNNTTAVPSPGETAAPSDAQCGSASGLDESAPVPHPRHRLAKSITSVLRTIALFLLAGGVTGAIVWRFDFRQPGALHGSASGIVVGVMIGSTIAAALLAALAFVVDLLFRIDWDAEFAVEPEECP
jgi:hypothetical protein